MAKYIKTPSFKVIETITLILGRRKRESGDQALQKCSTPKESWTIIYVCMYVCIYIYYCLLCCIPLSSVNHLLTSFVVILPPLFNKIILNYFRKDRCTRHRPNHWTWIKICRYFSLVSYSLCPHRVSNYVIYVKNYVYHDTITVFLLYLSDSFLSFIFISGIFTYCILKLQTKYQTHLLFV